MIFSATAATRVQQTHRGFSSIICVTLKKTKGTSSCQKNISLYLEVREECRKTLTAEKLRAADVNLETAMEMKYTEAAVKEALRVVPQTAGGLRVNPETRKLAGYDIPAGYTLTADPRIPFLDPENYPEPEDYKPERFLPEGASAAGKSSIHTLHS